MAGTEAGVVHVASVGASKADDEGISVGSTMGNTSRDASAGVEEHGCGIVRSTASCTVDADWPADVGMA